jgi:hypothetical protein
VAISLPPACPVCGSTRRGAYKDGIISDHDVSGEIEGRRYNRIVWRHTKCLDCGQNLTVREYHFEPYVQNEGIPDETENNEQEG